MLKIGKKTFTYKFIKTAFDIEAKFWDKDQYDSWHDKYGLEASDFCRIVRVSLIYAPLIVLLNLVMWAAFYKGVIEPIIMSNNPIGSLSLFLMVIGVIAVLVGILFLVQMINEMWRNRKKVEKEPSVFKQFVGVGYKSIKNKFCPMIKFED